MSANRLSFGVPGIDSLVSPEEMGYLAGKNESTRRNLENLDDKKPVVACITGPDGVGKSILSLSAASTFAASNEISSGRVIYASTDLNFSQAFSAWESFGFDLPQKRYEALRKQVDQFHLSAGQLRKIEAQKPAFSDCKLEWLSPFTDIQEGEGKPKSIQRLFPVMSELDKNTVFFLDLAEYSGGDDWSLINHVVGLLRNQFPEPDAKHLLVVDAVEGLEAMAGKRDRFGLERTRRSRLAQLIRLARKANCNVVFVIEQGDTLAHLDEVFVSDLVIKLRSEQIDGYLQKTIEIEKARGVSHVRGIHEMQIRSGKGGGNGGIAVPDDPRIPFPEIDSATTLSYLHVIPSLHVKPFRDEQSALLSST